MRRSTIENINRHLEQGKPTRAGDSRRRAADRDPGASSRRSASASCSCRCSSSPAWRAICSCRWPKRSSSRCSRRTSCRARSCRRWRSTCCSAHPRITRESLPSRNPLVARCSARFDGGFVRAARRLPRAARAVRRQPRRRSRRVFLAALRRVARAAAAGSARTSSRRSTAASSSCTCARRPARASRRRRRSAITSKRRSARSIPARELASIIDNIGLPYSGINLSYSTSAPIGPATPTSWWRSTADHRPTADYVHDLRLTLPQRFPGVTLLVPAGRHRHADPELRPARADRHPDRRPQHRRRTAGSPATLVDAAGAGARHRRPARAAGVQPAAAAPRRRPHARGADSGFTQRDVANNLLISLSRQQPDDADLLAEPDDRRQLRRRDADAAVPRRLAAGPRQHPGRPAPARRASQTLRGARRR